MIFLLKMIYFSAFKTRNQETFTDLDLDGTDLGGPFSYFSLKKNDGHEKMFHRESWWYPWDGTLNNQPHTLHSGYLLGISPFKGLLGRLKQLGYHPRVPAFSL